jgi:hypothetical protein
MLWRHLRLVRAWSAAGLLTGSIVFSGTVAALAAEPDDPVPAAEPVTQTVQVLAAKQAGDLSVELRGRGEDRVRMVLRNTSAKRLNVVLPAGLVAASATGQAGGGFQSMGLGTTTNEPGAFGAFQSLPVEGGFRSIPPSGPGSAGGSNGLNTLTVPVGQTVEVAIPAVCLNYGMPSPTSRDKFTLMDVDDYSRDPRVRKALRSLATLGTSHGVAQATMWHVCNDVPFEGMGAQRSKTLNVHEVALAARFVAALDASGASELVDPSYLTESRVLISVAAEGPLARDAQRLEDAMDGLRLLGLPVRVAAARASEPPAAAAPAVWVKVLLSSAAVGETRGRVFLERAVIGGGWVPLGKTTFTEGSSPNVLDATSLLKTLDHAIATAFVTVKPARQGAGSTTLKIDNHLPFTLARVVVKAGGSSAQPKVELNGLGIGPGRSLLAPIQAPGGAVDHIELNGL